MRTRMILAMTSNSFSDDRQQCLDVGMDDRLGKPVEPEMRYSTVLSWIDTDKTTFSDS